MKSPRFELPNGHVLPLDVSAETAQFEWMDLTPGEVDANVIEAYRRRYEFLAEKENPQTPLAAAPPASKPISAKTARPAASGTAKPAAPPVPSAAPARPRPPQSRAENGKEIGARLREARAAAGWVGHNHEGMSARFATAAGVSRFMVNKAEGGDITKPYIQKVCGFLHINRIWLGSGEGEMFTEPPPRPEPVEWLDTQNAPAKPEDAKLPAPKKGAPERDIPMGRPLPESGLDKATPVMAPKPDKGFVGTSQPPALARLRLIYIDAEGDEEVKSALSALRALIGP